MNQLDQEWLLLILEAKQLGLTVEDIREYLQENQKEIIEDDK
ncbi:anti-repressor SinI family protein [Heyndrickxia shackletonii]|nr:anti-repressor SinI family protein [Heyndrickxia shackletonii]NEY99385.1 DNA-binding anti-repressor SinI [Heyndrickxia shackletonii]